MGSNSTSSSLKSQDCVIKKFQNPYPKFCTQSVRKAMKVQFHSLASMIAMTMILVGMETLKPVYKVRWTLAVLTAHVEDLSAA